MKKTKKKKLLGEVVDRIKLIHRLESVSPGLAKTESIDQGLCFAFVNKRVWTYNGEIACHSPSSLSPRIEGAVNAKGFLSILKAIPDDEIYISADKKGLRVSGQRHGDTSRTEPEITLPIEKVERPDADSWKRLHSEFATAISVVKECASKDETDLAFACIHVTRKWVEACDNLQATRYRVKTKIKRPFIVKRDSIKNIVDMEATHFAECENWVHFKNEEGLNLSCRRHLIEFPDMTANLNVEGSPLVLPKNLGEDAKFAAIRSQEVEKKNLVVVKLAKKMMTISGLGVTGDNEVKTKVRYKGKPLAFAAAPNMLAEVVKRHVECQISGSHIRVDGDRWVYVACLESPDEVTGKAEEAVESQRTESETYEDEE